MIIKFSNINRSAKNLSIGVLLAATILGCSGKHNPSATAAEPGVKSTVEFSADSAYSFVAMQTSFGPRVPGSEAHSKTIDYLCGKLAEFGADTILVQPFETTLALTGKSAKMKNILGRFNADKPKRVLLLAHFDTRPMADEEESTEQSSCPIDGANDGASGVGVLLEIARQIGLIQPEGVGVDILFVDGEDSGISGDDSSWCLGTQYFTKNMPYRIADRPIYAILLDMVGGRDAKFAREYLSQKNARQVVDKVWSRAAVSGHSSRFPNEIGAPVTDDHLPLQQAGIPAIDIIESSNPQTGCFNPTWHTLQDNLANIDRRTLGVVGQVVLDVLYNEK